MNQPCQLTGIHHALAMHHQGRLAEAEALYREILQTQPQHFDALHLLGLIAVQNNQPQVACELISRALRIQPDNAEAHYNLGVAHAANQQPELAIKSYKQATRWQPTHVKAHYNRANLLRELGRLEDALADYRRVLELDAKHLQALYNCAVTLQELQQPHAALECFARVLRLDPNLSLAHFNRGLILHEQVQLEAAIAAYDRALQADGNLVSAYFNRGLALHDLNRLEEALDCFEQVLCRYPNHAQAYNSRGNTLMMLGQLDAALASIEQAICLQPDYAHAYNSRGRVLQHLGRIEEAIAAYDLALQADENLVATYWNKSLALLASAHFEEGWRLYEWRREVAQFKNKIPPFKQAPWLGGQDIAGKSILLYAEQGFGDTLQFCRYVPLVKALGVRVLLGVGPPLIKLLRSLAGVDMLISGDDVPKFDFHCPLMSLPLALKTFSESDIPAAVPYLAADADLVRAWAARLPAKTKLRVGLVWNSGLHINQPEAWECNARRNLPFELMAQLNHPDVDFFSLQKGEPAESALPAQLAQYWPTPNFYNLTEHIQDFADTAAVIAHLDLVISVDTAVAHLAGALGKPVWLLNRFDSCWRWLINRKDSPWYPTMQIFQQPQMGDWQSVITKVRAALQQLG